VYIYIHIHTYTYIHSLALSTQEDEQGMVGSKRPCARAGHCMVAVGNQVVVYGGLCPSGGGQGAGVRALGDLASFHSTGWRHALPKFVSDRKREAATRLLAKLQGLDNHGASRLLDSVHAYRGAAREAYNKALDKPYGDSDDEVEIIDPNIIPLGHNISAQLSVLNQRIDSMVGRIAPERRDLLQMQRHVQLAPIMAKGGLLDITVHTGRDLPKVIMSAHCNTLQRTATHLNCNTHCNYWTSVCTRDAICSKSLCQHAATCRNALQRLATCCNALRHTATLYNTWQHTAAHCNTAKYTGRDLPEVWMSPHCKALQHTATHCNTLQHTATHCNTLQHATTHCNMLKHAATHTAAHWVPSAQVVVSLSLSNSMSAPDLCVCVYTYCSVLQCVAVCCSVLQCVAVCCRVLQCVAVCCRVLQCVAVCCSALQMAKNPTGG